MKTKKKAAPEAITVTHIALKEIIPPHYNMRDALDREKLEQLQLSITDIGLQSPIRVKLHGKKYEVIAGFRRYRACANLHLTTIPAIISDAVGMDAEIEKMHENLQREDVSPLDEAEYYNVIIKKYHVSQKKLAALIGRTDGYVTQRLDIMRYPANLQQAVRDGNMAVTSARELYAIKNEEVRANYIYAAIKNGITPALAVQWRTDANNLGHLQPEIKSKTPNAADVAAAPTPQLPCAGCGLPSEITSHVVYRFDEKCAKRLRDFFKR